MTYYLDANIFIYANNISESYFKACSKILKEVSSGKIKAVTSTEAIQEIIFYSQKFSTIDFGVLISQKVLEIVPEIIPIDLDTIHHYLELVSLHPKLDSRDNLHVATCLKNGLTTIISADAGFDKIKEIKRVDPKEFIS